MSVLFPSAGVARPVRLWKVVKTSATDETAAAGYGEFVLSPLVASLVAFVIMLLGAATAVQLRRTLPDDHFTENAKDIVRLSASLMATLAALVLSLLISSANSAYEAQRRELREIVAGMILLDSLLDEYGAVTRPVRERLRTTAHAMADGIWKRSSGQETGYLPKSTASNFHEAIRNLTPADERQRELRTQALQISVVGAQARYILYEGSDSSLPTPFLVILMGWLAALFMSFCLFTPPNRIAIVALIILALSTSSALFMLLELSTPFDGLLALPERLMREALPPLP